MLATVALVTCLLGGVAAQQDSPLERTAYIQLMSECLGEATYRQYLETVAAKSRECGGGLQERGFSSLTDVSQNPSFPSFQPVQGTHFPLGTEVFPSLVDNQSRGTLVSFADSVPSISSPHGFLRHIQQKRAVTVTFADIQRTKENMDALVKNFICILIKMKVVHTNLDLNVQGLINSIADKPLAGGLKRDLIQNIDYCRDMTQCLPLDKQRLPVHIKLKRIMEYVKCEKEMRKKACEKHKLRKSVRNSNISRLPHDVDEIVTLLEGAQSAHELELI